MFSSRATPPGTQRHFDGYLPEHFLYLLHRIEVVAQLKRWNGTPLYKGGHLFHAGEQSVHMNLGVLQVVLAWRSGGTVVTGDPEFKKAEGVAPVLWLPEKPKQR
ncbi:MAG: hypothetical protein QHH75_15110 [Bacillota bacterium]|nr:hypothetical protein [Bacillota bacterium]